MLPGARAECFCRRCQRGLHHVGQTLKVSTPRLYVWKDSINRSQRFPATPEADTYTHVQGKSNPYYDIFFRMDTERKTIVFALGERKKEISVTEHTEWCWKLTRRDLRCQNMERLEQSFLDPFLQEYFFIF